MTSGPYYEHVFRPDLTTIIIIGRVTPEQAKAVVEKYFGAWQVKGSRPDTELPPVPLNKPSTTSVTDESRVQDHVILAQTIGITRFHPDYYKLVLGNHVLSGAFYASRLYRDLRVEPQYADAARHLAFGSYSRHDFEGAAREARRALAVAERDAHAWGVLGDAQLEVGRYVDARAAYARMLELGQDLHALARRAGLKSVEGDVEGAIADLTRAVEEGRASGRPRESVAWALWQLGNEHASMGDLGRAEASYAAALVAFPGYYRATAGLAHVRAAQGQLDAAVALYGQSLAVIPLPETAAALADVYAVLGRPGEAARQYALVEYVGRLDRVNKILYGRELAFFLANRGAKVDEALALAQAELEVRQDVYAYDVLAWALYRAGRPGRRARPWSRRCGWARATRGSSTTRA